MIARWDDLQPGPWRIDFHGEPPVSLNDERTKHWSARSRVARRWREAFADLARAEKLPLIDGPVTIEALPCGVSGDAGNHYPTVKAAIDGLVDAGILPDDGPKNVLSVLMHAPEPDEPPGLRLLIRRVYAASMASQANGSAKAASPAGTSGDGTK